MLAEFEPGSSQVFVAPGTWRFGRTVLPVDPAAAITTADDVDAATDYSGADITTTDKSVLTPPPPTPQPGDVATTAASCCSACSSGSFASIQPRGKVDTLVLTDGDLLGFSSGETC